MKLKSQGTVAFFSMLFCALLLNINSSKALDLSPTAKVSIITCTPGPDLYSLFGHTAIRLQDTLDGRLIDWVYNYGTFIFDDDFYVKFARGKLDYVLSKQVFPDFQLEYIATGRGIFEQELLVTKEEKQNLINLLEENYKPENNTYRYDFFYDNCATRVRDIIIRALSGQNQPDGLGFTYVEPEKIDAVSRINFTYVYSGNHTFRDAIQCYLQYQPWSDFGIDLALGVPCDKQIGKGQFMFLPDSLLKDFSHSIYKDQPLTFRAEEILPQEYELSVSDFFTPMVTMVIVLIVHLICTFVLFRKKKINISGRILLFTTGLLGLLVVFLWFFTDHTATKWNLNILWANPISLVIAFLPASKFGGGIITWLKIQFFILIGILLLWFVLPQRFNPAIIPLVLALIVTIGMITRPRILGFKKDNL